MDWAGRPVDLANTSLLGAEIQVSNGDDVIVDGDTPIFVDGIVCWAREARFGGVVIQPAAAWLDPSSSIEEKDSPKTLATFGYDGRAVLDFLIAASPRGSINQAIASLSLFAHPDDEDAEAPPVVERVGDEVEAPALVRLLRHRGRRSRAQCSLTTSALAH